MKNVRETCILKKFFFQIGDAKDCNWMILLVEDWNIKAIECYKKLGASFLAEWMTMKFPEHSLREMTVN